MATHGKKFTDAAKRFDRDQLFAPHEALASIDVPTLVILGGLMVLSQQYAAAGFSDACAARLAATGVFARSLLLTIVPLDELVLRACVLGRAISIPPQKWKKPRTAAPPEASSPHKDRETLAGTTTRTRRCSASGRSARTSA